MRRYAAWHESEPGFKTQAEVEAWIANQDDPENWRVVATSDDFENNCAGEQYRKEEEEKRIQKKITDAVEAERQRIFNKRVLADDLTEAFINYQHRLECPMPSATETKEAIILKYRSDPIFHAKVDSLVAGVMQIVSKHT